MYLEEIIDILQRRLDEDSNGDLYYVLAQIYKRIGHLEEYKDCLKSAIEEKLTLSYPLDIVRKELDFASKTKELEVEEVQEYEAQEEDFDTEDEDDYEEDLDEENIEDEDEEEEEY